MKMICRNRSRAFQFESVVIIASLLVSMHAPITCVYLLLCFCFFFFVRYLWLQDKYERVGEQACAHQSMQWKRCAYKHTYSSTFEQTHLYAQSGLSACPTQRSLCHSHLNFVFQHISKIYTQTNVTRQQKSLCITLKSFFLNMWPVRETFSFFLLHTLFRWPVSIAAAIWVVLYL